jgi:hypothetical protein
VGVQLAAVRFDQALERALVTAAGRLEESLLMREREGVRDAQAAPPYS